MQIFSFFGGLLGYILWGAFYLLKDFGLSVIVFTIIVKLIVFPFNIKQQKSMAGTQRLQKKQKELQEKYANNKQKLQEETAKLYEKEGVKPMGGCLTTIVPFIILLGIFYAVAYPLTNTLHLDSNTVNSAIAYTNTIPGFAASTNTAYQEINFIKIFPNIVNTDTIQSLFTQSEISTVSMFCSGFNTFGFNLLTIPKDEGIISTAMIIPILCLVTSLGAQVVMQKMNGNQMGNQQGCMKLMLYIMPLFTAYIAYTVPSAVGFYWICSNLISLIQSIVMSKLFSPAHMTANSEARHVALLEQNEASVPYVYAPRETYSDSAQKTKKKKK